MSIMLYPHAKSMPCHHFPWLHQERGCNIMVRPKKNRSNEREIKTNFVLKLHPHNFQTTGQKAGWVFGGRFLNWLIINGAGLGLF